MDPKELSAQMLELARRNAELEKPIAEDEAALVDLERRRRPDPRRRPISTTRQGRR